MTNNRSVLLISAIVLILLALVPAVSANQVIYDRDLYEYIDTSKSGEQVNSAFIEYQPNRGISYIVFQDITQAQTLHYLIIEVPRDAGYWSDLTKIEEGRHDFTYNFNGADRPGVLYVNRKTNILGQVTATQFTIFLNEWNIGDLRGQQAIQMPFYFDYGSFPKTAIHLNTNVYIAHVVGSYFEGPDYNVKITEVTGIEWKHHITVSEDFTSYYVDIYGFIDGHKYTSQVNFLKDSELFATLTNPGEEIHRSFLKTEINLIEIISPQGTEYAFPLGVEIPDPTLRTGSVTMTHVNGTPITGFEVTAVNEFTGESYTVYTDSDVANITLPMDRTMRIRDPITGEYEDTPVGYYRFFGYKPGYRMIADTGIQVTVLPEKYSSYQFCDILVTTGTENLRTGTVTMTDHNGTRISGFEVKAINAYTGESYTVSTETDTAVITLPMDRTITVRNPQTGEYEEAPVGYYRFFGYKPGYRMLNEDGIQVAVMPIKYSSYKLCDILVTQESGYLTGKHLFQIRSRADNSILQTGTISAQSATTGEWYNATVIDGLATLILPYDTSNPISQYAGNYYVYATSPGYEDSEYATQITVMPHTQSEINTIYLTPIGGIPEPGNVTLRIQAFSESGPGIPNAEIFISGVLGAGSDVWDTYTASSTGYLEVSVPGNSTYVIQASAPGYFDSSLRIEVFMEDPPLIEIKLYPTGWPTPTTQPTGWITPTPTTPPPGIPDEDDDSEGFLMEAIRGISRAFGVGFATAKTIFGMLLALAIGFATAKHLRGGAAEFGLGLLGGTMLGVLIGLLPIWTIVVLLLIVGMYIGYRYVGGGTHG